jgi:hypothetical protein
MGDDHTAMSVMSANLDALDLASLDRYGWYAKIGRSDLKLRFSRNQCDLFCLHKRELVIP